MASGAPGKPHLAGNPPSADLRRNFGDNLRAERLKVGLSQAELGRRVGRSQQYISMVEVGRENLTLDTMAMLANILGKDVITMLQQQPDAAAAG
jgi:transcriptional regulator with XRE-family HTH domain